MSRIGRMVIIIPKEAKIKHEGQRLAEAGQQPSMLSLDPRDLALNSEELCNPLAALLSVSQDYTPDHSSYLEWPPTIEHQLVGPAPLDASDHDPPRLLQIVKQAAGPAVEVIEGGKTEEETDPDRLLRMTTEVPVVRLTDALLTRAVHLRASDLLIEPNRRKE